MKVRALFLILSLSPIFAWAANAPPENRTLCEGLLLHNTGRYEPIKEGFEELSFSLEGELTSVANIRERLDQISKVLEENGVADDVLLIARDRHSKVNILALELLAKGVAMSIVDDFHGDWRFSEPSRLIIWDIRDPLYLTLNCQARGNCKSFTYWVKSSGKSKVLKLLRENIRDAIFYERIPGPGHVT